MPKKRLSLVLILLLIFAGKAYYDTNSVEIKRYQIRNGALGEVLNGLKVVHLSDLHFNTIGQREERILTILKQEKPDLMLITGDLIGFKSSYRPVISFIDQIAPPLGKFAVLGNTDYSNENGSCILCHEERSPGLKKNPNLTVLRNSSVSLNINGKKLRIVGTDDPVKKKDDLRKALVEVDLSGVPSILLSHSPKLFEKASDYGFDLLLCGHNHGGQIFLARYLLKIFPLEPTLDFLDGFFQKGKTVMYVSRGIGTSLLPFRLGVKPEITIFEFASRGKSQDVRGEELNNSLTHSLINSTDPSNSIIPINSKVVFLGLYFSNFIETFDILNLTSERNNSFTHLPINSTSKILFDFESEADLEKLDWECGKWFERSEKNATSGKYSLRVFLPAGRYQGIKFQEMKDDWSKMGSFRMDVFNPSTEDIQFHIRIDDNESGWEYANRFDKNLILQPGINHISIPANSIKTNMHSRPLNLKHIERLMVFIPYNHKPRELYIDNIHLQ